MEQIIITHPDGSTLPLFSKGKVSAVSKATQKMALLSDDLVSLTVTTARPLDIGLGDVITLFGKPYKVNELPEITKISERSYEYGITAEGVQYDLLDVNFVLPESTYGDYLYTELGGHLDALLWNIERIYPGVWAIGTFPEGTKAKNLTPAGKNCLQVVQELCSEYDIEFKIAFTQNPKSGDPLYTLNFAEKVGTTQPFTLQYGRGRGLYKLQRTNVNNSSITTRLYCYGSTENLGNNYQESKLHLPGKTRITSYIEDEEAVKLYGVKEGQNDYSDIYPNRIGKVTGLGSDVITFADSTMFDLNEKKSDGSTKWLIDSTTAKVTFQSGGLAGYSFDVHSYDHATKTFVINKYSDENGLVFPNADNAAFQIAVGDEYIIEDINLPDEYITEAEAKLLEEGTKDLADVCQPQVTYKLTLDERFFIQLYGKHTPTEFLYVGDAIKVIDEEIGVNKEVRITRIERNLLKPHTYDITLSDTVTKSTTVKVITDINHINETIKGSGLADPIKAKRNWQTAQELLSMIFDPEGDYYSEKIKPLSIETSMLSVGAKSQQFVLRNVTFEPNYNSQHALLHITSGQLIHYAIEDDVRVWQLSETVEAVGGNPTTPFYIYAFCSRTGAGGYFRLLSNAINADSDASYYVFLIGTLSSAQLDTNGNYVRSVALTYGFSTINGRFIKTGRIDSTAGSCYFDLDNNEIGGVLKFVKTDGTTGSVADLEDKASEVKDYINNTLPGILTDIQDQLDGQIEQWFYAYDPTNYNEPTATWISTGKQEEHLGDLFYNTDSGKVYRYVRKLEALSAGQTPTYVWQQLSDDETAKALALAQDALELATDKRRIFTSTPYTPYDVGDLWVQGSTGDILRCVKARESGSYTASDWEKASKYTDDTELNNFINGDFANTILELNDQIDGKIETFFQASDPSTTWADGNKAKHAGDMWYNTSTKRLYRYYYNSESDNGWKEVQNADALAAYEAASKAQDTADGKRTVFVSTPYPPYYIGDLWLTGDKTNGKLMRCIKERISGSYVSTDWAEAVYYDNTQTVIDGGIVTAGTVQLANGNSQSIVAGITGGETESASLDDSKKVRIWAGSSKANRFTAPFRVMQDGSFVASNAQITGTVNANKGTIGGFEISSGRIGAAENSEFSTKKEGLSLYNEFICFKNASVWAGIGTNVLQASTGNVAVARFENTRSNSYGHNYGMIISVSGGLINFALQASGVITTDKYLGDYAYTVKTPSVNTCTEIGDATTPNPFRIIAKFLYSNAGIGLPSRQSVADLLGISTNKTFAVRFTIIAHADSTQTGYVCGRNSFVTKTSGSTTTYPMNNANYPYLINPDSGQKETSKYNMGKGDIYEFMLVYDGSNYYAYRLGHQD